LDLSASEQIIDNWSLLRIIAFDSQIEVKIISQGKSHVVCLDLSPPASEHKYYVSSSRDLIPEGQMHITL
jgi:hypothetical protein